MTDAIKNSQKNQPIKQSQMKKALKETDFKLIGLRLHKIDFEIDQPINEVNFANLEHRTDLTKYVEQLIENITNNTNNRTYKVDLIGDASFITEVEASLNEAFNKNNTPLESEGISGLPNNLYMKEKKANKGTIETTKGSYIQIIYQKDDLYYYLGAKVPYSNYLDDENFLKKIGLDADQVAYKACIVARSKSGIDRNNIKVFDKNSKPAKYWYEQFLGLQEKRDDEMNTKNLHHEIRKLIRSKLRKYPEDFDFLYKSLVVVLKKKNHTLNYSEDIVKLFTEYNGINKDSTTNLDELAEDVKNLINKDKFDTSFNVIPSAIKVKSYTHRDSLNKIALTIQDDTEIENIITCRKDDKSNKIVEIKSNEIYDFICKRM